MLSLCFLCKSHLISFDIIKFLVTSIFFDIIEFHTKSNLKVKAATYLLVGFLSLTKSTHQTRKKIYFTSKALFVLEKIKF